MIDESEPEPAIIGETTKQAQDIVKALCGYLQALGWDAVLLSVSRVIELAPDDFRAPGATATVLAGDLANSPLPAQLADVLRKQADMLDSYATGPVDSGYIQDQSNYASNLSEWPK